MGESDEKRELRARWGTTNDLSNLILMYGQLGASLKAEALTHMAELLARTHTDGALNATGEPLDPHEWLTEIAERSYPKDDTVAELIRQVSEDDPEWASYILIDGPLSVVLSPSEDEESQAESLYEGFMQIHANYDPATGPLAPAEFFGITVSRQLFEEYSTEKGWVFDEVQWKYEMRHQCIQKFRSFVASWRRGFYAALLAG